MGGWLLDAAKGKSTGEPPAGLRADFDAADRRAAAARAGGEGDHSPTCSTSSRCSTPSRATRPSATRSPSCEPYLRQIHGALVVLGFARAAEALAICERLIADCARAGHPTTAEDMDWIAEGLSSLGFFLEPCLHGREPADEAIELFFARFEQARRSRRSTETQRPLLDIAGQRAQAGHRRAGAERQAVAARRRRRPELLEVFLEEADEVLQRIDDTCPSAAPSRTTARR